MYIASKQCIHYDEDHNRCPNDGVKSINVSRGGHDVGGGWHEMYQEMIYWFCDDHYHEDIAMLERLGWTVKC